MEFDLQPTLRGALVELRPLQPEDFDALYRAASDPLIWEQHPESDRYTPEIFRNFFDGAIASKGAFAVIECSSGRLIGSSRFANLNAEESEIEIGWTFLERAFWGGAYNREMKALMLDHALRFVERVMFVVGETNLRSQKAVEKIGATFFKTVEKPDRHGTIQRHNVFAITRASRAAALRP